MLRKLVTLFTQKLVTRIPGIREKNSFPHEPEERISRILNTAEKLDRVRDEPDWIEEEVKFLWNNVEKFEEGGHMNTPDGVDKKDYNLFKLGVLFGTDYEYYYPRDRDE